MSSSLSQPKEKDDTNQYDVSIRVAKLWLKKYFMEGQSLHDGTRRSDSNAPWYVRYRQLIGMAIPFCFFHIIWWSYMITNNEFYLFTQVVDHHPRYYMSITMIFGSLVGGATSEGGASVAFPVMTLVFGIKPPVARDFSFMIQSAGMTAAAFTICWMRVRTELHSILYCTLSGTAGIIFGLEKVASNLKPAESKMYFVSIWFAFAFSLYWLNRFRGRKVYDQIPYWEDGVIFQYKGFAINWKACVLLCFGFCGGIFSSISGSGLDICSFSCLTLIFRVSEKVATPTSVVLMGINTVIGFLYREFGMGGVESAAWGYLKVCVPIVVFGAPLGSVLGSYCHRLVLATFVYVGDTAQLIGALYVVQPWTKQKTNNPVSLCLSSAAIIFAGMIGFKLLAETGRKLLDVQEEREREEAKNQFGLELQTDIESKEQNDELTSSPKKQVINLNNQIL